MFGNRFFHLLMCTVLFSLSLQASNVSVAQRRLMADLKEITSDSPEVIISTENKT